MALICRLAGCPTKVLCAGTAVITGGAFGAVVVQVKLVLEESVLSLTVTVTELLAAALVLTVPEIKPVDELIDNPVGRPVAE